MNRSLKMLLLYAAIGGVAYFAWKKYKAAQLAAAHPIVAQPDAKLIQPLPVNPSLVTDAQIVS